MIGAILGDMIGAPYEFDRSPKKKEFPLFSKGSQFTDDSVMTIAVAEALMTSRGETDDGIKAALVESMQKWGRKYPNAGYGGMFYYWLKEKNPEPYNSFGNGSAMRVAAAGWLYDTLEETRHMARLTAEVSHNHPEGIKGAEATASAIFLARNGHSKEEIKEYVIAQFGYDLSRTCDEIRPKYHHVETCQETVPEAITAFLEGKDFEDVIRTAVSLGGDCDTLTCIACSIAEAFYGIPTNLACECRKRLPEDMLTVLDLFIDAVNSEENMCHDCSFDGNVQIEEAIEAYHADKTEENLTAVLESIRKRMHEDGHFILPAIVHEDESSDILAVWADDGNQWYVAFTSQEELDKGYSCDAISHYIDSVMEMGKSPNVGGVIINPWGKSFDLDKKLLERISKMDGGVEHFIPDYEITPELLKGGAFLKRSIGICNRNRTERNLMMLLSILRDSWVWVPCTAIMSDADYAAFDKMFMEARDGEGLDSLVGKEFVAHDETRMVPDILESGEDKFFPVFTSAEEMGEYGERFSKVESHFLDAIRLARNNEANVYGIVINPFSEPFEIPKELFDFIEEMDSSIEREKDTDE